MSYQPFGERVIIRQLNDKPTSGMVIPTSAEQEDKAIGIIVEIPSNTLNCDDLEVGDTVIYDEFAGSFIPGEKDLIILKIKDILAKKYE